MDQAVLPSYPSCVSLGPSPCQSRSALPVVVTDPQPPSRGSCIGDGGETVVEGVDGDLRLQVFEYLFLVTLCKVKRHRITPFECETAPRQCIHGMLHKLGLQKSLQSNRGGATVRGDLLQSMISRWPPEPPPSSPPSLHTTLDPALPRSRGC